MHDSLYLAREILDGDPERLRRLLADHTGSERAATALVIEMDRARRDREVSHCVLYPRPAVIGDGHGDGRVWKVRFGYDDEWAGLGADEEETAGAA